MAPAQQETAALSSGSLLGPFAEGNRLVLECESTGGFPAPMLVWWRENTLIDDSFEWLASDRSSGSSSVLLREFGLGHTQLLGAGRDEFAGRRANELLALPSGELRPRPTSGDKLAAESGNLAQIQQEQAQTQAARATSFVRNRLELPSLGRADALSNYSCQALNNRISSEPPSTSIVLDMNCK